MVLAKMRVQCAMCNGQSRLCIKSHRMWCIVLCIIYRHQCDMRFFLNKHCRMCIDAEIMVITKWKEWLLVISFAYSTNNNLLHIQDISMYAIFRMCREHTLHVYNIIFYRFISRKRNHHRREKVRHNRFLCSYTFLHKQFACALNSLVAWIFIQIPFALFFLDLQK